MGQDVTQVFLKCFETITSLRKPEMHKHLLIHIGTTVFFTKVGTLLYSEFPNQIQ